MQYVGYILGIFFIAMAYWITNMNSIKYANYLLITAILSLIVAQIKPIQMFSLVGIVVAIVIMVKSQSVRQREVAAWFLAKGFKLTEIANAADLFEHETAWGTTIYTTYKAQINQIPFIFGIQYNSHRTGNSTSIELHCSYYFYQHIDLNALEKRFNELKEQTPRTNLLKSQFGYFDLKKCEINRLKNGALVVSWRVPDTIPGYEERYEWVKKAIEGMRVMGVQNFVDSPHSNNWHSAPPPRR